VALFNAGARDRTGRERVHDRLLTVPNLITAVRLAGLPLFAWLVLGPRRLFVAFLVLVAIATTDWIDGYVARRFDQVSRVGKVVDPLVDRLLLATAVITLMIAGLLPWPLVVLIVVRDALVLGASLVWFGGVPPIAVSNTGKLATALLMIGVPAFLLAGIGWPGSTVIAVLAWITTAMGIATYYLAGIRYGRVARAIRKARAD
jgi:cardiolipin synthase